MKSPYVAARYLRRKEEDRVREIRDIVVVSVNNVPIRVEDLVTGGPVDAHEEVRERIAPNGRSGRASSSAIRRGSARSACRRPKYDAEGNVVRDAEGNVVWVDEDDKVQGIVLMRKNEATLPALNEVKEKVDELNKTRPAAARRADRAVLRPDRPDPRHHRDGAREPAAGHGAGDGHPAHVPQQRPHAP